MRIKTLSFITLLLGLATASYASMITSAATDPPCAATGFYSDLIATNGVGGCSLSVVGGGSLVFSNFTFTPAGVGTPAPSAVGYTLDDPGTGIGGATIYGFNFNPGLAVIGTAGNPNAIQDILLTYKVVAVGTAIQSIHLMENAAGTGTGVGQVSEVLTFCTAADPDPTLGTCHMFPPTLLVSTVNPPGLSDVVTVAPWTSMAVSKDINASSGTVGSTATISQVLNAVDLVVPEPETWSLLVMGVALVGISRFRSRKQKQS